jgi:putative solute:sodium symporter small subunit
MPLSRPAHTYWSTVQRLTGGLLLLWFVVTFVLSYFSRELSFLFFGWPFGFWMAAQGGLLVYAVIVAFYAWFMNRLDEVHGIESPLPLDPLDGP